MTDTVTDGNSAIGNISPWFTSIESSRGHFWIGMPVCQAKFEVDCLSFPNANLFPCLIWLKMMQRKGYKEPILSNDFQVFCISFGCYWFTALSWFKRYLTAAFLFSNFVKSIVYACLSKEAWVIQGKRIKLWRLSHRNALIWDDSLLFTGVVNATLPWH
jgi:hypothetical protein